jgi:hypothetical protein
VWSGHEHEVRSVHFFIVSQIYWQLNARMDGSTMLAGRAFQGVGSGVILSLVEIVLSDLVPLSERYVPPFSRFQDQSLMRKFKSIGEPIKVHLLPSGHSLLHRVLRSAAL